MSPVIRLASAQDASSVLSIYSPIVQDSTVSFEDYPPGRPEMEHRILKRLETFPWLICELSEEVVGYAYAGRHRERAAYRWAVEVSVYVAPSSKRRGVGAGLYTSLFNLLRLQGFYRAYAGITLPNQESVGFHEAMGFHPVGVYRSVGYKLGAWHDVGWWQMDLNENLVRPVAPLRMAEIQSLPDYSGALRSGLPRLRL